MKIADLAFYKGISVYPIEVFQSTYGQVVGDSSYQIIYPYRGITNQYYSIDDSSGDTLFYGDKLLNNNVLFNGDAYLCPFIGAKYQIVNDTDLDFTISLPVTNISGSNTFSQVTYPTITFEDFLPAQVGTVDGINAIRFRQSYQTQTDWYGAYPCSIFQSTVANRGVANVVVPLNNQELEIIDFDIANTNTALTNIFAYFITNDALYWLDTSGNETAITLPANFTNLTAMCSYQGLENGSFDDYVIVAGLDSTTNEQRVVYFDVITGDIAEYKVIGSGGDFKINRMYFAGKLNFQNVGFEEVYSLCTQKGLFLIKIPELGNFYTVDNERDITDVSITGSNLQDEFYIAYSTTAGFFWQEGIAPATGYETSKSFTSIAMGNSIVAGGNGYVYFVNGLIPTDGATLASESDHLYLDMIGLFTSWFSTSFWITSNFGLAGVAGGGIRQLNLLENITPSNTLQQTLYFKFTLDFNDIVKEDVSIYYGLLSIIGCGEKDAAAALFKIDTDKQIGTVGTLTGTVTTNRLWIADNYFILNNTQDKNSLFYKSLNNLNLAELTGNQEELVGEDAGTFNTTEAGDVVDIIIDRSMFYLVGTRAVEVWQNGGATGFPYRKQPNQTAEFHNLPKGLSSVSVNVSRYAPYKDGYVIAAVDNTKNELAMLYMASGASKAIPYNKNGWLQIVNNYIIGANIQDVSVTPFKFYGKDCLSFMMLDENNDVLGNIVINQNGNVFFIDMGTTNFIRYNRTVTQTGVLTEILPSSITSFFDDYIHQAIAPTSFDYVMTSELIRPQSSEIMVDKVFIQYMYQMDDVSTLPSGSQYKLEFSPDGRDNTWVEYIGDYTQDLRQIVVPIMTTLPSLVVRFSSNIPVIIIKSIVQYSEVGVK